VEERGMEGEGEEREEEGGRGVLQKSAVEVENPLLCPVSSLVSFLFLLDC